MPMETEKVIEGQNPSMQETDSTTLLLLEALSNKDINVRGKAARDLGKMGSKFAVNYLLQAVEQDDEVRAWAAWALGQIGGEEAIAGLTKALKDKNSEVRAWATWALGEIGCDLAVEVLLKTLKHYDADVRWRAVSGLGKISEKRPIAITENFISKLLKCLEDSEYYVRTKAAEALGKTHSNNAIDPLVKALSDQESSVRYRAAYALGQIATEDAMKALLKALEHTDSDVRVSVVYSLGQIGTDEAIDGVMQALKDPDYNVRAKAAEVLGKNSYYGGINALLQALTDKDHYVRWRAATALGEIGDNAAVTGLLQILKDKNPCVRGAAASALGQIGHEAAVTALRRCFQDDDSYVRKRAAEALVKINSKSAIPKNLIFPESQPDRLPKIIITSCADASEYILCTIRGPLIKHLISIGSPGVDPPKGFNKISHRLRLEFDDIDRPHDDPDYTLATTEHIHKTIDFISKISHFEGNLLIHCQAGISRSAAIALTVLAYLLGAGQEEKAIQMVLAARPQAMPNLWVVELADEALHREGKLLQVAEIYHNCGFIP